MRAVLTTKVLKIHFLVRKVRKNRNDKAMVKVITNTIMRWLSYYVLGVVKELCINYLFKSFLWT